MTPTSQNGDIVKSFGRFYLDNEKDMIINLYRDDNDRLFYEMETPNHHTGNLIRNFAAVCQLPLSVNDKGLQVIRGEVPAYIDGDNRDMWILRFGGTKVANIFPDGRIERKASVPAIAKTLMSQTKDYRYGVEKTIFKTYIRRQYKFRSDLHTHMNGNLSPDILIALGIAHQIRYPLYYVRKLGLVLTNRQEKEIGAQREKVARQFADSSLTGKYLARKINDNTFINFADLILHNLSHAADNIVKIRISLAVLKDGQAVFTNLEKVYLYRYVFCKGIESENKIDIEHVDRIPDRDVRKALLQMLDDQKNPNYWQNTIFQDRASVPAPGHHLCRDFRHHSRQEVRVAAHADPGARGDAGHLPRNGRHDPLSRRHAPHPAHAGQGPEDARELPRSEHRRPPRRRSRPLRRGI